MDLHTIGISFDPIGAIIAVEKRLEILEEENKILKRRIYCLEMQQKTPERPPTDEELKK